MTAFSILTLLYFAGPGDLFVLFFAVIIGLVVVSIVKGIGTAISNSQQPIQSTPASVVAKRTNVSGGAGDSSTTTSYYVTFELNSGERREFGLSGREYGMLAEGDRGELSYQGTWYKGFRRSL